MIPIRVAYFALTAVGAIGCITLAVDNASGPSTLPASERSAQVLATGAAISSANGMAFGPDGLLYVASYIGSEIVVLDPESGEVKRRISEGVDNPDDIAFSSDGSFYWTSLLTGEVAGMRPDGSRVSVARLTPGSNPITFSPDDRLFGTTRNPVSVREFDTAGAEVNVTFSFDGSLRSGSGLALSPDGNRLWSYQTSNVTAGENSIAAATPILRSPLCRHKDIT